MVREALTALGLAVFVSGILGVLIYLGADALMELLHRCLKLADKTLGEPAGMIRVKPERRAGSQARPNRLRKASGDALLQAFRASRHSCKCR